MHFFLVNADNLIVNVILWDGEAEYDPAPLILMAYVEGGEIGQPYPGQ